jgi:hypothetical protein
VAIVVPPDGELAATARRLLELADDVRDVRTVSNGTQFDVPDELAELYMIGQHKPRARRKRGPATKEEEE